MPKDGAGIFWTNAKLTETGYANLYSPQDGYITGFSLNNGTNGLLLPIVKVPLSRGLLTDGGIHGEDYHISPIADDGTVIGDMHKETYNIMTPNNYGRTGESIDYTPTSGTHTVSTTITGESADKTFTTENLGWNIWGEDNENIYLVSNKPTTETLPLKGAEGYNNGVITQDNIAKDCYSNSEYSNMTARTMKIEDIEYITLYDYTQYTNYNKKPYTVQLGQMLYPVGWGAMSDSGRIENRSKQVQEATGTAKTITEVSPLINYWGYTFNRSGEGLVSPDYYKLLNRPAADVNDNSNYWLSSRSTEADSATSFHFGLQMVQGQNLASGRLYSSTVAATPTATETAVNSAGIRPVVIIPKSSCIISNGGDNGETYHIQPRQTR